MITRRTKVQLAVFLIITLVGCTFVGARYARIDRWFYDDSYTVTAHLAESGGIYEGAEVSYRGVEIGRVGELELTEEGVDVHLDIDKSHDQIPADARAVVGNRSAIGEQYVELQPRSQSEPFLEEGTEIAQEDTVTPIAVETLLHDISATVSSVDQEALRTTVHELGVAFDGTGTDLETILDTTSSFIETADANFDVTTALLRDSNTVLRTQVASESSLRTFARDLSLFTGTLAASDPDLRSLIVNGSAGSRELSAFLAENKVDLGDLLRDLVTTGRVVRAALPGFKMVLTLYPYVVEGGFTVASKTPETGLYDSHFGLIITDHHPCQNGYEGTHRRTPFELETQPMNEGARCTDPPAASNARGAQNYRAPVAAFDPATGALVWGERAERLTGSQAVPGSVAPRTLGKDSWKWLYLQPLTSVQE
jgi:phospholipid/cholesterol/gamma-HCH transport system substrate-binding protein